MPGPTLGGNVALAQIPAGDTRHDRLKIALPRLLSYHLMVLLLLLLFLQFLVLVGAIKRHAWVAKRGMGNEGGSPWACENYENVCHDFDSCPRRAPQSESFVVCSRRTEKEEYEIAVEHAQVSAGRVATALSHSPTHDLAYMKTNFVYYYVRVDCASHCQWPNFLCISHPDSGWGSAPQNVAQNDLMWPTVNGGNATEAINLKGP